MRSLALLLAAAALVAGCVSADEASSCSTDNPDYPDCLPDDDGGKADNANAARAQMNDLTIVVPLAASQAELDAGYLKASDGGTTPLLPKKLYTDLFPDPTGPLNPGADVKMRYANLRVVAVRFDPCFANVGPVVDASTCDNQIRLVFQSLDYADGATAVDGAVHAFYRVPRAELTQIIQDVITLRKANGQTTAMGPLAPHPLLVKQGLDGAFGKGLRAIILAHASSKNLIRFTHFESANLQTVWNFSGFDISGTTTQTAKPMVIPTMPSHGTGAGFFQGFAAPMAGGFTPESTSADSISLLVNATKAKAATKTKQKAAYAAALRIENPNFHSPNTIDCASCHLAQPARLLVGDDVLGLSATDNPNLFARDAKYVSARSMKQTTSLRDQPLNVHMLSYRGDQLMIGQRVINETAALVAYLNSTVFN
ncbi:MAG TPA: hypothetical protein VGM90_41380 [Kofleriaceae bacterium]|jgi:hypothetical protein